MSLQAIDEAVAYTLRANEFRLLENLHQHQTALEMNPQADASWLIPWEYWSEHLDGVIRNCGPQTFERFLKTGFQPDHINLLIAADLDRVDHVELILKSGVPVDARFSWSHTALQYAVHNRNLKMVHLLLQYNADVNQPAPCIAVDMCRWSYKYHNSKLLMETKRRFRDKKLCRDALQSAVEHGDMQMVQILLSHGANANGRPGCYSGATALQIACMNGYIRIVQILLTHGADIYAEGAKILGRTALVGAAERGRLDVVRLLLETGKLFLSQYQNQIAKAITKAVNEGHCVVADELRKHCSSGLDDDGQNWKACRVCKYLRQPPSDCEMDNKCASCHTTTDGQAPRRMVLDNEPQGYWKNHNFVGGNEPDPFVDASQSLHEQNGALTQTMPEVLTLDLSEAARSMSADELKEVIDFIFQPRSELENYIDYGPRDNHKRKNDEDDDLYDDDDLYAAQRTFQWE